jgi:23S rRNA pseudouridine1911/1915/1917 synthase
MPYRARTSETLLDALAGMFEGRSRKDLRRLIRDGRVSVNGARVEDPAAAVEAGAAIEWHRQGRAAAIHPAVRILHEDDSIIVIDKGPGILTAGGVRGGEPTVVDVVSRHLEKKGRRASLHACHRLDRDVSGLVLLALRRDLASKVRNDPHLYFLEKTYHALVEGTPTETQGTIRSRLEDHPDRRVRPAVDESGKLCVTHYRVLEKGEMHSTLELSIETGRKNQIRAHMEEIGHPVAGDRKYGARTDPARRVALHATILTVIHPVTGEKLPFVSPPPASFAHPPASGPRTRKRRPGSGPGPRSRGRARS